MAAAKSWARAKAQLATPKRTLSRPGARKALRTGAAALLGAAVLFTALFFSLRNVILRGVLDSRAGDVLSIGAARFNGLAGIELEDIRMQAAAGNFDAAVKKCSVRVDFLKMLVGRMRLKRLALSDINIELRRNGVPAAVPPEAAGETAPPPARTARRPAPDSAGRAARWLELFFARLPDILEIEKLAFHSDFGDIRQSLFVPHLAIPGAAFETRLEVIDGKKAWTCLLTGLIDREERRLDLRLRPQRDSGSSVLPYIGKQWGLKIDFDSLDITLHSRGRKGGVLGLDGLLAVNGLILRHPRIASEDVRLRNASIDYDLRIGADYFELDKATKVSFNALSFHPHIRFQTGPSRQLTLRLEKTAFKADDFFSSLPAGLFTRLDGIRTEGLLIAHLDFFIDFSRPEELRLESGLEKRDFRIRRFGRVDFRAAGAPFLYTVFQDDWAVRSFMVGPENRGFLGFDEIPAFLKNAVLISEDGGFFRHRGFLPGSVKESIAANLKEKRFVRGASTISMQLVKNLYLERRKTIARKLEEMIITWLIEENRLIGKERMFEIYINIIEWGPDVYGAREASRFYFDKDVAGLTLAEAIFLAAVIPRPGRFMTLFDEEGRLRPWVQAYYDDVARKMLQRGWISPEDFHGLTADVRLRGPARRWLKGDGIRPEGPER